MAAPSRWASVALHVDSPLDAETEGVVTDVVDALGTVRVELGPGLLERGYAGALEIELADRGHQVERELWLPFEYKGRRVDNGYKLDVWVDRTVVLELKTVEELRPEHYSQLATYLRLTGNRVGLLVNFHASPFRTGIKRLVR